MILVTGHKGFIGGHLCAALRERGATVLGVDKEHDSVKALRSEEFTAVFHMGAISDTTCNDRSLLVKTNVHLTHELAFWCRKRGIPFIYASSASVYGNQTRGLLQPLNLYAQSKARADVEMEMPDRKYGLWYGCRFFNVYGPGEAHKGAQASMVHQIIQTIRDGERPRLFEPGAKRDFVHVDDVVKVMLWLWQNRPATGFYDIGTGRSETFEAVVDTIEKVMGVYNGYTEIPMPESLRHKYQFNTKADLSRLRSVGYMEPFMTLEEGVRRMLTSKPS